MLIPEHSDELEGWTCHLCQDWSLPDRVLARLAPEFRSRIEDFYERGGLPLRDLAPDSDELDIALTGLLSKLISNDLAE